MDQCRLCLLKRRNLRSLFLIDTNGASYIDMVTSIANVKIIRNENGSEGHAPENICLVCRKKLREAYDFKLMVESSNLALQNDAKQKRIYFSNLNEIKVKVEFTNSTDLITNKKNSQDNEKFFERCFNSDEKTICYKNIMITRIYPDLNNVNTDYNKTDNICDFLNTFKDEPNSDCNDDNMDDNTQDCVKYSDDEYKPNRPKLKKKKKKTASKKKGLSKILIKPVFLDDLQLIKTKPPKTKIKIKVKNKLYKKKSMCNYCGKMASNIQQHLLQHSGTRKYKCKTCSKDFFTESSLKHHEKIIHIKEKKFMCDQCLYKFKTASALNKHMLVHTDERNYACSICNKAFKHKMALLRHVLIHSAASKTIKCELCNMSFISIYGLKHHMRVHTGERPYRCEMCSQGYSYKHDFNRHCLKKHGVFFKRRSVYIMNEEVLQKERELMRKLMLRVNGIIKDDEPLKVFDIPQGHKALEQAIKLIETKQIPVDLNLNEPI